MQNKNNMDKFILAIAGNKCDIDQEDWLVKDDQITGL
jgi:hypothetical protein